MNMPSRRDSAEHTLLRLAIFGIILVAMFVALFSRLWFLQVLATDQYQVLAQENRVRRIHSEPPRGRILDRNGNVIVDNKASFAVTIDKQVLDVKWKKRRVLNDLSALIEVPVAELRAQLQDITVSPYKPVAVAVGIPKEARDYIIENQEDFPGVDIEDLPSRDYPAGTAAAHLLGYVSEISSEDLEADHFKDARPKYQAGDLVGKAGLEYMYDRFLRGRPEERKVVVNASGEPLGYRVAQEEAPGQDLVLHLDLELQEAAERALADAVEIGGATGGAVVVMDPNTGGILAMASNPSYNPRMIADGISIKEAKLLFDEETNLFFNRAIQAAQPPGSTYKIVTAGAALANDVVGAFDSLPCTPSATYPPEGGSGSVVFNNWTSAYNGSMGFAQSLETSCDTFYYELGWRMESAFGPIFGDGTERFQKYARTAGMDRETGVDLPGEAEGRVPDEAWLDEYCEGVESEGCDLGWLPGYTVNMSIGQGDLVVTPMQMAVTTAAIANGGQIVEPRLAARFERESIEGVEVTREIEPVVRRKLPLDATEIEVIQQGLIDVVSGAEGTATGAFAGFPLDEFPVAGKTGTAQLRTEDNDDNDAWFVSYAPADAPQYVVAAYVEKTSLHGGSIAAPIAREIYEAILGLDEETEVQIAEDQSG